MDLSEGAKDIFETIDDEISDQEAMELDADADWSVSATPVFEAPKKHFEFLHPNQELKFFKTPRSNPNVDHIEGSKDILDEFDIKISEPRPWNYQPIKLQSVFLRNSKDWL